MAPRPASPPLAHRLRTLALTSPTQTAVFYARLYAALFPPTDAEHDSLHVLSLCLLAAGQAYPALHVVRDLADTDEPSHDYDDDMLRPARRPGCYGCAVIVAKCCHKLGRFSEGEQVLERAIKRSVPMTLPTPTPSETAATASLLLASLSHKGKAPALAAEQYTRALAEDPWLWEAFTGLCDIGAAPARDLVFADPPSVARSSSQRTSRLPTLSPNPMPRSSASEVPNFLSRRQMSPLALSAAPSTSLFTPEVTAASAAPPRLGMMGNPGAAWDTSLSMIADTTFPTIGDAQSGPSVATRRPLPNLISSFIPSASSMIPAALRSTPNPPGDLPSKPPAMKRPRGDRVARKPAETPVGGPMTTESRLNGRDLKSIETNGGDKILEPPVRRSSRLNSTSKTSRIAREKRSARSQSVASSGSGHTAETTSPATEAQTHAAVDDWLRDIVRRCGRAYRSLALYQCQEALNELDGLPLELQHSPWALDIAARCMYELSDYTRAQRAFKSLIEAEPYRLESMELYSTLLWHMNDQAALSHLSQVLVSIDREAPQPWIAAGNCFSLQRDHDEAMRCFRRATQLDPGCAYAWTLCGFEAAEMEEYDRAIAFYRTAIRADARHYNAWYHMGSVYLKLGKIRHAEHHLRRAAEINPSSPVLLLCIGEVLEQSDNLPGALAIYEQATRLKVESAMAMVEYKRIRVLVALGRIAEAIAALQPLARLAPDEANIQFLLGKCYMRTGRNAEAMVAFASARELQPKLDGAIKVVIGARGEDVAEEDEGM
ncbi:anaphase-promoting complex subunit cdc27 [Vanrija albida]|uniref:Anaphase-promoting complex subunit cdc27 n=1 Tax=Vanrija albida TaxID=181172 RepID=A0ABR3Q9Z9_9TREE